MSRPKIALVVTHHSTACVLMKGQLAYLRNSGFETLLISSPHADLSAMAEEEGFRTAFVPMVRNPSIGNDLVSLRAMVCGIRRFQPDIVSAGTPKAGLLGMLAGTLCRTPARVYVLRGLRLETSSILLRKILTVTEWVASRCAHRVVCVSASLRDRYLRLGLTSENKAVVLGSGSSNGVDTTRFSCVNRDAKKAARIEFGVPDSAPIVGFVGRLCRDKGIADLAIAFWDHITARIPSARLLLVGEYDQNDPITEKLRQRISSDSRIIRPGFVQDTARCYQAMDVLAFPSYREGFPNAPLEAAACGVPVVGYCAIGTVDAVQNETTGYLVPVGDVVGLAGRISDLIENPDYRLKMGVTARQRVEREFPREKVWEAWANFYWSCLSEQ